MVEQTSKTKHNVGIEAILATLRQIVSRRKVMPRIFDNSIIMLSTPPMMIMGDIFVLSPKENSKLMNTIKIEAHCS